LLTLLRRQTLIWRSNSAWTSSGGSRYADRIQVALVMADKPQSAIARFQIWCRDREVEIKPLSSSKR
jgi:hypothetical protein